VDEQPLSGEAAPALARRLALAKARRGWRETGGSAPVLGADTVVVVDGEVLGKPAGRAQGLAMLERLSGRTHSVLSAVALVTSSATLVALSTSRVRMRATSVAERAAYWATGEPADKAGGYAVQGRAAAFIAHLEGSYSGVMGLPLFESAEMLRSVGFFGGASEST
jgi:nucleoside triphosphate pyrophosphatase